MKRLLYLMPLALLTGCDLEKTIEVPLPAFDHQLMVECYLQPGKPYALSLRTTSDYFASPLPPDVPNATVVITHKGQSDTLKYIPGLFNQLDTITRKFNNYRSSTLMNGQPGDLYSLYIKDQQGRTITGTATFLPAVPIDTLEVNFNAQDEVSVSAFLQDPPGKANFYRFMCSQKKPENDAERDFFTSDRIRDGEYIAYGTGYRYHNGDTLVISLYSLEKPYYTFLNTINDAEDANGNPFAQPAVIESTVQGGFGAFTVLSFDRDTIIVKK
jgi:hypothetical protein